MSLKLITGGTVVGPTGAARQDVLIDGERVAAIFMPGHGPSEVETIDATGKYVIPGAVDAFDGGLQLGGIGQVLHDVRPLVVESGARAVSPGLAARS